MDFDVGLIEKQSGCGVLIKDIGLDDSTVAMSCEQRE
jgi:hypothetical protein